MLADLSNPYASDSEKLSMVQRRILIHCMLYYELDTPVLDDSEFDELMNQYDVYRNNCSDKDEKESEFGYVFEDFDKSTGFDLCPRLIQNDYSKISMIADFVYKSYEKGNAE